MNPIEHAWSKLKERIYELDPAIESYKGANGELIERFSNLIDEAWELLGQNFFDQLVESMPRRIEAVIAADGWYTKY
jgi:hypothetical protein